MGRVATPLAACAIAFGLLAGASNAIVAADDDTTASDSAGSNESAAGAQSAGAPSAGPAAASDPPGGATDDDTGTTGQPFSGPAEDDTPADEPDEEPSTERPADEVSNDDSARDDGDCEPPADLAPTLQFAPEAPQFAPPPAELPPVVPPGPGEPVPLEAAAASGGAVHAVDHYAPPVMSAPIVVAPKPIVPVPVSGSVGTPRVNTHGTLATGSLRSPAPSQPHQATPGVALSNGGPAARIPVPNQTPGRETVRGARVSEVAMNAMPGIAGLVLITAGGICIGYRQAVAAQRQQRFVGDLSR